MNAEGINIKLNNKYIYFYFVIPYSKSHDETIIETI